MKSSFVAVILVGVASMTPAAAVPVRFGGGGGITVGPDLGACATVTFAPGELVVGHFSAVAEMQGPGTMAGTVRGAIPFTAVGSWSGCISGAYPGATAGEGRYVLDGHSASGDVIEVKQCVVNRGAVTCV